MARKRRFDAKGVDFHVMDRGRGQSPIFLERDDYLFFLECLADAVRRGEILVLAFVLMTNHYHLLLRSLGALSRAMCRIKGDYVTQFNRRYGCDGTLCRSRFRSKPVRHSRYRRNAILYFDENPLLTNPPLADAAEEYEWSSAHYFARGRLPRWLSRAGINEAGLSYRRGGTKTSSTDVRLARKWFIEARLRHGEDGTEALSDLLSGDVDRVRRWLLNQTDPAHEGGPCLPIASPESVCTEVGARIEGAGVSEVALASARVESADRLLRVGLMRDVSAQSFRQIASSIDQCQTTAKRLYSVHGRALREFPAYVDLACEIVDACVAPLRE